MPAHLLATLPIGLAVSFLASEVLKTAEAAQDVMVEKESFNTLATYLKDIHPILVDVQNHQDIGTQAVEDMVNKFELELQKASSLINKCKTKSKFYLLMHCRVIVKDLQGVTRDIAETLDLLRLACVAISMDIRLHAEQLTQQMRAAEFQASEAELQVIRRLEAGVQEQRIDQEFVDGLVSEIALAVGVPAEPSIIQNELARSKREKEDAAESKQRMEEDFMDQVLALLSTTDLAYSSEESVAKYEKILECIHSAGSFIVMPPYKSFFCPLTKEIMNDPVTICNGQSYEREAIEKWFAAGNVTDPESTQVLVDMSMRPNIPLRKSINEWTETNYCTTIYTAKENLNSGAEEKTLDALKSLTELCELSHMTKDWIAQEGLVEQIVQTLNDHSLDVKEQSLLTLLALVKRNDSNKRRVSVAGGVKAVVKSLSRGHSLKKSAATLLMELLKDGHARDTLEKSKKFFLILVTTYLQERDVEVIQTMEHILDQLSDKRDNVVKLAEANWCKPLIKQLCEGSEADRLFMAQALMKLELNDEKVQNIVESGGLASIVILLSHGLEAKYAAVVVLRKLSTHQGLKENFAKAGAVRAIVDHILYPGSNKELKDEGANFLVNITREDGVQYLVDADGAPLPLEEFILKVLDVQISRQSTEQLKLFALQILLNIVNKPRDKNARDIVRNFFGIPILLDLIDRGAENRATREIAVQILAHLGEENGGSCVAKILKDRNKIDGLLTLLKDDMSVRMQAAGAKIIAKLPHNDGDLTNRLCNGGVLPTLVSLIQSRDTLVKENAIDALRRFTISNDLQSQQRVADLHIQPLLLDVLEQGSSVAKERAALVLRDFSLNALVVGILPRMKRFSCISIQPTLCKVHQRLCSANVVFCLVESHAVGALRNLLSDDSSRTVEAGIDALSTLVLDAELLDRGAQILHDLKVIMPLIGLLSHGSQEVAEKAVLLLDSLLKVQWIKEMYAKYAQMPLLSLTSSSISPSLKQYAVRVLSRSQFTSSV